MSHVCDSCVCVWQCVLHVCCIIIGLNTFSFCFAGQFFQCYSGIGPVLHTLSFEIVGSELLWAGCPSCHPTSIRALRNKTVENVELVMRSTQPNKHLVFRVSAHERSLWQAGASKLSMITAWCRADLVAGTVQCSTVRSLAPPDRAPEAPRILVVCSLIIRPCVCLCVDAS